MLVFPYYRSDEPFGKELVWYVFLTAERVAWENGRHFATVSPRNDIWETSTEIPYWWRVTTLIWVVLLISWRKFPSLHDQSEVLTRSRKWNVISMTFLCSSSDIISQGIHRWRPKVRLFPHAVERACCSFLRICRTLSFNSKEQFSNLTLVMKKHFSNWYRFP